MEKLQARQPRVDALARAAGPRVQALWRTGSLPSAAHGAPVGGVRDAQLAALRHRAALLHCCAAAAA
eukprot:8946547-Pyramimonas_sp.AAC.1